MEKILNTFAHFFIPRSSNNHKARLLHSELIAMFIIGIVFSQIAIHSLPKAGVKILGYAAQISPTEVVRLTNEKRAQAGVEQLEISPELTAAAKAKGEHMLANNYWAHIAPDGTEPWSFFLSNGYKYRYAGENLARDFTNPSSTVEAWMASPSHRENLLSTKYKEIGVAVVEGDLNGVDTTIVVQMFGSKLIDTTPALPLAQAESIQTEATPTPTTLTPTPTETPNTSVVAQTSPAQPQETLTASGNAQASRFTKLLSPFSLTRDLSLAVVAVLLGVMVLDGVITHQKRVSRIGGRAFAHIAFFGMILAVVLIARAGLVL